MNDKDRRRLRHYVSLLNIAANEVRVAERDDDDEGLRVALPELRTHLEAIESLTLTDKPEVPK